MNDTTYKIVNGEICTKYVLHKFTMGDVEDIEIYAAEPILEWQKTPEGKFCMEKATDLEYHTTWDYALYAHRVVITGYLSGKHATFYALKKST